MRVRHVLTLGLATLCALPLGLAESSATAGAKPEQAAGRYAVHGVDISAYQHPRERGIDWNALSRSGQKFVAIKATEGSHTVNRWFARDLAGARSVKLIHTAYHYFDPTQGGAVQAEHFLNTVHPLGLDRKHAFQLPLELDLEGKCGVGPGALTSRVVEFLDRVQARTGVSPTIYTQKSYVDRCMNSTNALGKYRVRLAHYHQTPPPPLPGGTGWSFWQYTDSATVPGILGKVDANVFNGTYNQLKALAHLT